MTKNQVLSFLMVLLLLPALSNCNKLIDAGEPGGLTNEKVFNDDSLVLGNLVGIYYRMMADQGCLFNGGISLFAGLSADELVPLQMNIDFDFFLNDIKSTSRIVEDSLWNKAYRYIYYCNFLLEGLAGPNKISPHIRDRVIGEAKFLRSFCYYYLTQLFGDVPLVLSTLPAAGATMPRTNVNAILQFMLADVKEAATLLGNAPSNRFAGKSTCQALLARICLHLGDWANAEQYSNAVIASGRFQLEEHVKNVFTVSSKEIIFQLQPVAYPENSIEGYLFLRPVNNYDPFYTLSQRFVSSFAVNDLRKEHWIKSVNVNGSNYDVPYKYRIATATSPSNEYNVVMRLAEMYLIRSEARARQSLIAGAMMDLNRIRDRAGLPVLSGVMTMDECLLAIEKERRQELFTEWGHRWIDLKRTKRADAVLSEKWQHWKTTCQWYPIPAAEIVKNPNLQQNEGY